MAALENRFDTIIPTLATKADFKALELKFAESSAQHQYSLNNSVRTSSLNLTALPCCLPSLRRGPGIPISNKNTELPKLSEIRHSTTRFRHTPLKRTKLAL
jgi:hypothetical protein